MRIMVSACLLGVPCRYDGGSKAAPRVLALRDDHELIPVCPEQLGGLATPRPPCEISQGRVINARGEDRTAPFLQGAQEALRLFRLLQCRAAILKSRSPSCGKGLVYDATFSKTLVSGNGLFTQLLLDEGVRVFQEEDDFQADRA